MSLMKKYMNPSAYVNLSRFLIFSVWLGITLLHDSTRVSLSDSYRILRMFCLSSWIVQLFYNPNLD